MRKTLIAPLLALGLLRAAPAFSLDFLVSAGVGGAFGLNLQNPTAFKGSTSADSKVAKYQKQFTGGGAFAFLDLTLLELSGGLRAEIEQSTTATTATAAANPLQDMTISLEGGAFAKLPVELGGASYFYPVAGVEYQYYVYPVPISLTEPSKDNIWLKAGAGFDFGFNDSVFLKIETLFAYKLMPNQVENAVILSEKKTNGLTVSFSDYGAAVRVALGYRLKTWGRKLTWLQTDAPTAAGRRGRAPA